ncbi:uncharacterized protein E0L32_001603 [Thyridium curvatum]|uniref:Uncharacterized protein n=1 Tax=Thyridium curvatum TaxID=1093900 RepID=A0A507AN37_9PEZI|nr:uncharacterized protein E0L32_001603 [Thyridium curvatum]TPX09143.1 hypothetical protein E0L32_001603 [Thyridium curvatum]
MVPEIREVKRRLVSSLRQCLDLSFGEPAFPQQLFGYQLVREHLPEPVHSSHPRVAHRARERLIFEYISLDVLRVDLVYVRVALPFSFIGLSALPQNFSMLGFKIIGGHGMVAFCPTHFAVVVTHLVGLAGYSTEYEEDTACPGLRAG